jgi:hypothetical protein
MFPKLEPGGQLATGVPVTDILNGPFFVNGLVQARPSQYIPPIDKGRPRCFGPRPAADKEFYAYEQGYRY